MMQTEVRHYEEWHLEILPDEGETWPAIRPYTGSRYEMVPDRITLSMRRGTTSVSSPSVSVSGLRLRKDGTTGSLRVHRVYYGTTDTPAWAAELVAAARSKHNLTAEALSR